MTKSKPLSHKRKRKPNPKPVLYSKKAGTRKVTVANLERLTAPVPRTFVNDLRLKMGTNVELPSAIHNTNVNFVNYYKELEGPPKLGNGSIALRPRGPLLTNALAASAEPAGGGGGGSVMPWRPSAPSAPSVGPHSSTFRGFGVGTGPYGALSPNFALNKFNVNSLFSPKGGARRRSTKRRHK